MAPWPEKNSTDLLGNLTAVAEACLEGMTGCLQVEESPPGFTTLDKFKYIKVGFLAVVMLIVLASVCKMFFQLFVKYSVKHDR